MSTPVALIRRCSIHRMPKEPTTPPSEFWVRLVHCWGEKKTLPTSQNGIAKALLSQQSGTSKMSQGSVNKWYTGEGLPDRDRLAELARKGDVTIDWLLLGHFPKRRVEPGSMLERLLSAWETLPHDARELVLRTAEALGKKNERERSTASDFPEAKPKPAALRRRRTG